MADMNKITEGFAELVEFVQESQARMEATGYRSSADQDAGLDHPVDKTTRYFLSNVLQFCHRVLEGSSQYPSQVQRVAENEERMLKVIEDSNNDPSVFMNNNQFLANTAWRDYGQGLVDLAKAICNANVLDGYAAAYSHPWTPYRVSTPAASTVSKPIDEEAAAKADEILASLGKKAA